MEQIQTEIGFTSNRNKVKAAPTPNVWILALPFFSHAVCASRLAERIARHGLAVTLLGAKEDIQRLQMHSRQLRINWDGLDIYARALEIESTPLADSVNGHYKLFEPLANAEKAFEQILRNELDRKSKPTYVIIDSLLPGSLDVATRLKIPACLYVTFSAGFTAASIYLKRLARKGIMELPNCTLGIDSEVQQHEVISLPGLPLMSLSELNGIGFKGTPMYAHGWQRAEALQKSEVLLLTTFRDLEPRALDELGKILNANATENSSKMPHIWPIGPLFPLPSQEDPKAMENGDEEVNPCIKFLDSQSPSSVVYVAFGTDVNLPQEQIQELAYGLESAQHPFLCVLSSPQKDLKSDTQVHDIFSVIPPDCLARIGSRGMFVKWAPQMDVLSHPSTGAFMSHCGYNSLLESVCQGVPIIAWPMTWEQTMNRRQLVDDTKIALQVGPGLFPGGMVDRKDIEKIINSLFHSDEGTALRNRSLQMKQRAEASVGENGSSTKNMQALVALIEGLAKQNLETPDLQML